MMFVGTIDDLLDAMMNGTPDKGRSLAIAAMVKVIELSPNHAEAADRLLTMMESFVAAKRAEFDLIDDRRQGLEAMLAFTIDERLRGTLRVSEAEYTRWQEQHLAGHVHKVDDPGFITLTVLHDDRGGDNDGA